MATNRHFDKDLLDYLTEFYFNFFHIRLNSYWYFDKDLLNYLTEFYFNFFNIRLSSYWYFDNFLPHDKA